LLAHSVIAGAGIVLLLAIVFRNGRHLLLVLVNLPFALVGGVLAIFLAGYFGEQGRERCRSERSSFRDVVRHHDAQFDHDNLALRTPGGRGRDGWGLEAAVRGATERLAPILMTALVTALGLLPLAIVRARPVAKSKVRWRWSFSAAW